MKPRYYLHGDQHETIKANHYCAFCDLFVNNFEAHRYTKHSDKNDYERYLFARKRIKNIRDNGFYRLDSSDKTNLVA